MKALEGSSTATWPPGSPASSATPQPERFALAGRSRRPDPRIHAYRSDVADIVLADRVFAPHYARAETACCVANAAMLRERPDPGARAVSQLVRGEGFLVLDIAGEWAWGRCAHDDYVGYLRAATLGAAFSPTHRVIVPRALVFAAADIKAPVVAEWPIGSRFAGTDDGAFVRAGEAFLHRRHTAPLAAATPDPAEAAERLIGLPYLWGGRGGGGIDCSGLVQVALGLAGIAAPRDSDMQRALGGPLDDGTPPARGDLVCFEGHVGIMADATRLIHAAAHWMRVVAEPLADVLARFDDPARAIVARRRLA